MGKLFQAPPCPTCSPSAPTQARLLIPCIPILPGPFPPPTSLQPHAHHHPNPTGSPAAIPQRQGSTPAQFDFQAWILLGRPIALSSQAGSSHQFFACRSAASQLFVISPVSKVNIFPQIKLSTIIIHLNRAIAEGSKEEKTFLERRILPGSWSGLHDPKHKVNCCSKSSFVGFKGQAISKLKLLPGFNEVAFSLSRIACLFMQIHCNQLMHIIQRGDLWEILVAWGRLGEETQDLISARAAKVLPNILINSQIGPALRQYNRPLLSECI